MARNKLCTKEVGENGLIFTFSDGTELAVDMDLMSDKVRRKALYHGFSQKLGDSYAGAVTVTEAKERFKEVLKSLEAGTWNAGRSSDGGIWVEAIARATGATLEAALEKWEAQDDDARRILKAHPVIKKAKLELELEKAQKLAKGNEVDLDSLL